MRAGELRPGAVAITAACVIALGGGALAGCGDRSTSPAAGTFTPRSPGTLTVATSEVPDPGFWVGTPRDPTGGFEYELAKALADRFDLGSVRIRILPFHRIVSGDLGGADLALDLLTPTSEREENLDFSMPYLTEAPTVVVRSGTSVPDLATAQELRWGAVDTTTFVDDIQTTVAPDDPVRIFDRQREMLGALERGRVDAVMFDLPLAVAIAEQSDGALDAAAQLPDKETIAAALPKGSDNVQAVDSAIRAFTADGSVDDWLDRWVGSAAANADTEIPLLHTTR